MTDIVTYNYIFILFFILAIFITLFITLTYTTGNATSNIGAFFSQTPTTSLIFYIIALSLFFAYMPHDTINKFYYFFMCLLIVSAGYAFLRTMSTKYVSPYYETPQKSITLICFIAFVIIIWYANPGDIFNTKFSTGSIIMIFLLSIFTFLYFITYLTVPLDSIAPFQKSIQMLLGFIISVIFIAWLTWSITSYTGKTGYLSIILAIILVIILGILILKTYQAQFLYRNREKNALFDLLANTILYIPCLFSNALNYILAFLPRVGITKEHMSAAASMAASAASNIGSTRIEIWILLLVALGILLLYFLMPTFKHRLYLGSFQQFINDPLSLNVSHVIGSYGQLKGMSGGGGGTSADDGSVHYNYRYGISLWVYLDALPPNTSAAYATYSPIFNYGNKPSIEYNASLNSLRVIMGTADTTTDKKTGRIVFEHTGIPLQKWINIVVNYDGGTVDTFLDGTLLKSIGGVTPYMTMDNLVVGSDGGLYGKVCNVIYSNTPFTMANIYYMRYLVKDSNPPMINLNLFTTNA